MHSSELKSKKVLGSREVVNAPAIAASWAINYRCAVSGSIRRLSGISEIDRVFTVLASVHHNSDGSLTRPPPFGMIRVWNGGQCVSQRVEIDVWDGQQR